MQNISIKTYSLQARTEKHTHICTLHQNTYVYKATNMHTTTAHQVDSSGRQQMKWKHGSGENQCFPAGWDNK